MSSSTSVYDGSGTYLLAGFGRQCFGGSSMRKLRAETLC